MSGPPAVRIVDPVRMSNALDLVRRHPDEQVVDETLETAKREHVLWVLRRAENDRTAAAKRLGVARSSLLRWLRLWGV